MNNNHTSRQINTNSDRDYISKCNVRENTHFQLFFNRIEFGVFRNVTDLNIEFKSPVSVIAGSNRCGKTTVLLTVACSHYNFKKRSNNNGTLERVKWSDVMRFTSKDKQDADWTYYVSYREGDKSVLRRRGQRKYRTKKWNGVAKKESQIGTPNSRSGHTNGRNVILVDIDRIVPSRNLPVSFFYKVKSNIQADHLNEIKRSYLSYVFEEKYDIDKIYSDANKVIYSYKNDYEYSSYNTASGEDALTRIISDIVDAERNSLILIEEIEIGLHPKFQRRLMDVIYHEARISSKQFIITTHSATILSSIDEKSRIFIEKNENGALKTIYNISVNAALSKMDSRSYPLLDLFVEDLTAKK